MGFSYKQKDFIYNADKAFINIADGAVRSGKTFASVYGFTQFALEHPKGDLVITGRTLQTIKRNVISPMEEMLGRKRVRLLQGAGELYICGRRIYVIGAGDEAAESRFRGFTGIGAYCNELTLQPEAVFNQLIDRMSLPGARIYGDTNPDSPYHWLNEKFLENEEALRINPETGIADVRRVRFLLSDNPSIRQDYIDRLHRLHTGVWLKRMVYGLWVAAEGAIYDMFDFDGPMVVDELPPRFDQVRLGADYGTTNPTVFLLLGRCQVTKRWYVFKEYVYDSKKAGRQKTDGEFSEDLQRFIEGYNVLSLDIDPSAASFKRQLKSDGVANVKSADNEVIDGIRTVGTALNDERLFIHRSCKGLIKSLSVYAWDPKAQEKGEDKPLKINDHEADALRYACRRIFGRPALTVKKKPRPGSAAQRVQMLSKRT
jgi:PBSX family phage terminase large subunit